MKREEGSEQRTQGGQSQGGQNMREDAEAAFGAGSEGGAEGMGSRMGERASRMGERASRMGEGASRMGERVIGGMEDAAHRGMRMTGTLAGDGLDMVRDVATDAVHVVGDVGNEVVRTASGLLVGLVHGIRDVADSVVRRPPGSPPSAPPA